MKKITREIIESVIGDKIERFSKHTSELLLDSIDACNKNFEEIENKELRSQLSMVMIPYTMADTLCRCMVTEVLCELLCDEEKENESSDENNVIIMKDGQSLTVRKGNQRIEINDNGVMVANGELELNK